MKSFRSPRAVLLAGLIVVLLLALTVLQYRWIAELSALQQQQMERNARASTDRFVAQLDRELEDLWSAYHVRSRRNPAEDIAEDHAEWAGAFEFPEIVDNAYWVAYTGEHEGGSRPTHDGLTVRRISVEDGRFVAVARPPFVDALRAQLVASAAAHRGEEFHESDSFTVDIDDGAVAFVVAQTEIEEPKSWAVVILRRDMLVDRFFPALVREHFGEESERRYAVRIVDEANPGSPLFASEPTSSSAAGEAPDLTRRLREFGGLWRGRDAGGGRTLSVAVTHRAGSVEAAIARLRRRNFGFGFGVVFVLGASIVVLAVAARRAQQLAAEQMAFVAGISHELRTPISGISSLSQNLADGVVEDLDGARRYGQSIHRESRRLAGMVEGVLHFSAIGAGRYRYARRPVRLADVIDRSVEAVGADDLAERFFEAHVPDDLPTVMADTGALESVVRNLLSNALKFTGPSGEIRLSARLAVGETEPPHIELCVRDSGPGIAASELERIFDPFYRGRSARAGQIEGSGLGLTLVKEIVDAHDGRVEVASKPGEGSVFRVYLPVATRRSGDETETTGAFGSAGSEAT